MDDRSLASDDNFDTPQTNTTLQQSINTSQNGTPATKSIRPKAPHIHQHSTVVLAEGECYNKCSYCSKKYAVSGGTKSISDHLRDEHQINPSETALAQKCWRESSDIEAAMAGQGERVLEAEAQKKMKVMASDIDKTTLGYLFVK